MKIDYRACADLVRTITLQIASTQPSGAQDASIAQLIGQVTRISAEATQQLRHALHEKYPEIGWNDEEDRPDHADSSYWLYDPIDGAYHYLQGLPLWSASLSLVHRGETVFSVVFDPAMDELFVAVRGEGSTLNGRSLHVSPKAELQAAVVGTAVAPRIQIGPPAQEAAIALFGSVAREVFVVRPMAATSLQLAYVAAGRLDAYFETGDDAADWLAGALLIREAGGTVSDLRNEAFGWSGDGVLATNSKLHSALVAIVGRAGAETNQL
ncbi:inositol monophosphatase [Paraburkholderia sp. C35]|uniref:inositol monophosphatase family protein n=1 Tax=Paraburkholderia sp. C35 TaxID=2126993 RepID=UPI000D69D87A|nr:inositol monophosphatase [Paraburkholderia sp. C35]